MNSRSRRLVTLCRRCRQPGRIGARESATSGFCGSAPWNLYEPPRAPRPQHFGWRDADLGPIRRCAGTRVSIELKQGDPISGVAQWSDGGVSGSLSDQQIDVLALLKPSARTQPRMPRIELNCAAWVRQDGNIYRTRALNISQGGIRVSGAPDLSLGADVIISVPGLATSAGVVRWKVGDEYGIGFNRVFAVDELMAFLRQQRDNQLQQMAG